MSWVDRHVWNWSRFFPVGTTFENASLMHGFLVALPLPWIVDGGVETRFARVILTHIRAPDDTMHNHAAAAIRIPLKGGYREEWIRPDGSIGERVWRPGMIGYVPTTMFHRIIELLDGDSWSLWLRGVVTSDLYLSKSSTLSRPTVLKVGSHRRRARSY